MEVVEIGSTVAPVGLAAFRLHVMSVTSTPEKEKK